jgi:hypothetical protein
VALSSAGELLGGLVSVSLQGVQDVLDRERMFFVGMLACGASSSSCWSPSRSVGR